MPRRFAFALIAAAALSAWSSTLSRSHSRSRRRWS